MKVAGWARSSAYAGAIGGIPIADRERRKSKRWIPRNGKFPEV